MKTFVLLVVLIFAGAIGVVAWDVVLIVKAVQASEVPPPLDARYCSDGRTIRHSSARDRFRKVHACPVTKQYTGPCPGWEVDHIIPLACGGCDNTTNMQWLPSSIKRHGAEAKDKWERKIYCPSQYRR